MKRIVLISLVALVFVACQDGTSPADTAFEGANFDFVDGAHNGGNVDFFFLPPLTSSPRGGKVGDRPRNPDLEGGLFAKICELNFGDDESLPPEERRDAPEILECVGGDPEGTNEGQVASLAMTLNVDITYSVNWQTGDAGLNPDNFYRIEIFLGNLSFGFRDVDPDPGPPRGNCRGEDFCQFNNGANVAIKVIIESGAACLELDGDPDNCATATVGPGGTVELEGVASATPVGGGTINIQPCPDLRDIGTRPTSLLGRVDNRTFGPCIEIIPLDPDLTGIATLCDAFDIAIAAGVSTAQARRMTVHRHSVDDDFAFALSHDDGPPCAPAPAPEHAFELNRLERFVSFARTAWRAVSDRVVAWIEPAPLFARTAFRCNVGGCAGIGPFRSSYQVATPVWMDAPNGTDLGTHPLGTVLTVRVRTRDSGELVGGGTPVPELANDVRLTFTVTGGTPVDGSPLRTGVGGFADGIAEFDFTVGAGVNTVVVEGIGVGVAEVADDGNPVNNVFGPSINSPGAAAVPLAVGTLTFNATGLVSLVFAVDPGDARLGDGDDPLKAVLLDVDGKFIQVCVGDAEDPDTSLDGTTITLTAIKNNGDPVDLEGGTAVIREGCATFENLTIDKTGAYRLVANGEFESLKFNVRPAKKK